VQIVDEVAARALHVGERVAGHHENRAHIATGGWGRNAAPHIDLFDGQRRALLALRLVVAVELVAVVGPVGAVAKSEPMMMESSFR